MRKDTGGVNAVALRDGFDGRGWQRHGLGHGHVKPDKALQAFGAPAMGGRPDQRRWRDQREFGLGIVFLHRGILCCGAGYAFLGVKQV